MRKSALFYFFRECIFQHFKICINTLNVRKEIWIGSKNKEGRRHGNE